MKSPHRLGDAPASARSQGCRQQVLAQNAVVKVCRCDHGIIHLVLGDLTLRVASEDFEELQRGLALAVSRMAPRALPC